MTTVKSLTRQQSIVAFIREFGEVTIDQISVAFKVSEPTIRRDLTSLSDLGIITKTHGKIIVNDQPRRVDVEFDGDDSSNRNSIIDKLGQAASNAVGDDEIVFIGPGAITYKAAHYLAGRSGLVLQICSLRHASLLRHSHTSAVWVLGGKVDPKNGYITGGFTMDIVRRFHADTVIVGCIGVDPNIGIFLPSNDLALLLKEALSNGRKRILVVDSSRCNAEKTGIVLPFKYIDQIITDTGIDQKVAKDISHQGVQITLV